MLLLCYLLPPGFLFCEGEQWTLKACAVIQTNVSLLQRATLPSSLSPWHWRTPVDRPSSHHYCASGLVWQLSHRVAEMWISVPCMSLDQTWLLLWQVFLFMAVSVEETGGRTVFFGLLSTWSPQSPKRENLNSPCSSSICIHWFKTQTSSLRSWLVLQPYSTRL